MQRLQNFLDEYYKAIVNNDNAKKDELDNELRPLIVLLLNKYGQQSLDEVVGLLDEVPAEISYQSSDETVDKLTDDLGTVLIGLQARIDEERTKAKLDNPDLTEEELINLIYTANLWQLTRIINSEEHIITSGAELDVVGQLVSSNGQQVYKTWVAVLDARTCPECIAMNGTTIPVNEHFELGGSITDSLYSEFAMAHPNCRCTIKYSIF